jgi:hypothetical protein
MISGRLEKLFSGGYVEGWAFDSQAPERPLVIDVRTGAGGVIAQGLANLFRDDLADRGEGLGWCAFRLRLAKPAAEFMRHPLALHDKDSGFRIDFAAEIPFIDGDVLTGNLGWNVAGSDPFVIGSISQLRACEDQFARFVRTKGVNAFVRAAYIYALGRLADPESLAIHGDMMRNGRLAPFRLLKMIADTKEFRSRPRELAAPNAPGFPFIEAAHAR